jgi:uncharacterized membrane protein YeaQ/YmgE (transglycosylase-associated protein family)
MLENVLAALVAAFVTGALARFAVPGPDPMPAWLTIAIGLVGTVIGGGIVVAAAGPNQGGWVGIAGFLTSIALVVAYRRLVQKRSVWGPDAYRFPQKGVGVDQYRERLERAGIDPNSVGSPFAPRVEPAQAVPAPAREGPGDPTENPAHYLTRLEELHDSGVLTDEEFESARTRLLERLRA